MRVGSNPFKDKPNEKSDFLHQIIIPVYIPHFEDYFKDSFVILKLCLKSLFSTVHDKTFITIINNGSCVNVNDFLNELYNQNKIHEIIHTINIGKLNAILKGLAGSNIELITISDCDVLFKNGWQEESLNIFSKIPKVGVVGIVPQINMHKTNSFNLIFDNLFNSKLRFLKVKDKQELSQFYDSLGWDKNYNHDYLEYVLVLSWCGNLDVLVGSGHFVATYKKDIFNEIISYVPFKMGGFSESYLDEIPLLKDYWRVSTSNNFAFHMGNVYEEWMEEINLNIEKSKFHNFNSNYIKFKKISKVVYIIKNKILQKLFKQKSIYKLFLRWKKLPNQMIKNY